MKAIKYFLKNHFGFQTQDKIIVFESDDWGSIRTSSGNSIAELLNNNSLKINRNLSRYYKYDSLETSNDLQNFFEVLNSVKDNHGNHCKMTPMFLVANPAFELIREKRFDNYCFEPITHTYSRYAGCENSFQLIQQGISDKLFFPQFHGREHLNIKTWMTKLRENDKLAHFLFNHGMWGISEYGQSTHPYKSLQAAFYFENSEDIVTQQTVLKEGLELFETLFGYKASCFTPPNGPLSSSHEKFLSERGIKYIQTARVIYREPLGSDKTRIRIRYLGKRNKFGQLYLTRNAFFEPSEPSNFSWIDKCLEGIKTAFDSNKPAIISSHRVNYTGSLSSENQQKGLSQLRQLLKSILKQWPDVIFMSSEELGCLIAEENDVRRQ